MKIAEHVKIQSVDDGAIIFDSRAGQYAQINIAGLRVISGVRSGLSATEIIDGLTGEFDVAQEVAEQDVASCLADMLERGWLEVDHK